jgi:hypothetical protein
MTTTGPASAKGALNRGAAMAALGILALLAGPHGAMAGGWQTGAQVEEACAAEPETNPVADTFCLGYLQGALDAFLLGRANCIPGTVDANGLRAALLEHVRGHPEAVAAASGPMLVYDAFRDTWPSCSQMPALQR